MVADIIRDAPFGQIVRYITHNRVFQYPEERDDWVCPDAYSGKKGNESSGTETPATLVNDEHTVAPETTDQDDVERQLTIQQTNTAARIQSIPIKPQRTEDGAILVDWYVTDDPENPQNWTTSKKVVTSLVIGFYTFTVYAASSIYVSAEQEVSEEFNVSHIRSTLGLALYVLGYGVGPLLFSPLSEIPAFGRNLPYITSFFLYVIMCIPTALTHTFSGLLFLRFFLGFLGSPCLATGGASMQDIYSFINLPIGLTGWVASAYAGPAFGPVLSVFAVQAKGWRWTSWITMWMAAPALVLMFFFLPETSGSNILLRRAQRLRKRTHIKTMKSQSEIDQANMSFSSVVMNSLVKPLQITILDPAVLFTNLYTAFIYGIYYSFFEVFPLVYGPLYGFSNGTTAVVFTCIVVSAFLGVGLYVLYIKYYLTPDIMKRGLRAQEHRLVPALLFVVFMPIGLFLFGWTARPNVHWIVSVIGIVIYGAAGFVVFQCVFMYIPLSYMPYAASLFAANDFFRSSMAAGAIIFAQPLYGNLGIGRGVSILGGLSCLGIVGMYLLYFYGAKLRAMSKFAM